MPVEVLLGVDADQGPGGAGSHAAGLAHQHLFAGSLSGLHQRILELVGALAHAGQVHADIHFEIVFCVFKVDAFRYLFKLFNRHSTAHLSSCSIICSPDISPATSPSERTTGARLQAPTQRAVIRLICPFLVVCPWGMPRCFSAASISLSAPLMYQAVPWQMVMVCLPGGLRLK